MKCRGKCNKCERVPYSVYEGMSDSEKDNETLRGICRIRKEVDRLILNDPLARWVIYFGYQRRYLKKIEAIVKTGP